MIMYNYEGTIACFIWPTQAKSMDLNRSGTFTNIKKHKLLPSSVSSHTFSDVEVSPMDAAHYEHQRLLF